MDLRTLSRVLTQAITALEDHLTAASTARNGEEIRKTAHALATLAGSFIKTLEAASLEARIEQLQIELDTLQEAGSYRGPN